MNAGEVVCDNCGGSFVEYMPHHAMLTAPSGWATDDEDEDPRENRLVQLMTRWLPLSDRYHEDGLFFIIEALC